MKYSEGMKITEVNATYITFITHTYRQTDRQAHGKTGKQRDW